MINREEFIKSIKTKAICVGVTKNRNIDEIEALYKDGVRIFGENRVQELLLKCKPNQPWEWHFIGYLQKNKVSKVIQHCTMIQTVDSIELLEVINKHLVKANLSIDILIQINTLNEPTKHGCKIQDITTLVEYTLKTDNINLRGFMVMGPTNQNIEETRMAFKLGFEIYSQYKKTHPTIDTLSMGMSFDYKLAIECGATMVRLGSILFEERPSTINNYPI